MSERLPVTKTYKLYVGGKFIRSESGRTTPVPDAAGAAHVSRASRKDLRLGVEAARRAQAGWASATAYLRGQVLYRLAEMLEGRRSEFALAIGAGGEREVDASIDRVIHFAGWTDKFGQVLGGTNAVAGPYHNFTVPEPSGVVGVICPDEAPLLGLASLVGPVLAAGNACVVLASPSNPLPAALLGEALATSDLPPGVANILTGVRDELVPHYASHRAIDAVHAAGLSEAQAEALRAGAAENLKRVTIRRVADWFDDEACEGPWWIEPFVEHKTIWHPSAT